MLTDLAEAVPAYAAELHSIAAAVDQRDVFRLFMTTPPSSVPLLSRTCCLWSCPACPMRTWQSSTATTLVGLDRDDCLQDETAKAKLAADLRDYCQLDTYAMVEIQRAGEADGC